MEEEEASQFHAILASAINVTDAAMSSAAITPFAVKKEAIEGFRYRCEDALKATTKAVVREARVKQIKAEILNSDKLKSHFEENPLDLEALRHDKPLHTMRTQAHLKHVPQYLLPENMKKGLATALAPGDVRFTKQQRGGKNRGTFKVR